MQQHFPSNWAWNAQFPIGFKFSHIDCNNLVFLTVWCLAGRESLRLSSILFVHLKNCGGYTALCLCVKSLCVGETLWQTSHIEAKIIGEKPPDGEDMGGYIQINKQTSNTSLRKYLSWKEILNNWSWCCSSLPLFNILSCCHLRGEENNLANWELLWSSKKIPFFGQFQISHFTSFWQKQILSNLLFVFFCTFSVSVCHQKLGGSWK